MAYLSLLAIFAGAAVAAQASMHAQLGILLKNALLATGIAFTSSLFFTLIAVVSLTNKLPSIVTIKSVPYYLWFSGGLLSTFAIATFYWLIPKMGIGPMMSFALSGQLLLAIIAGHYGWFQLPVTPVTIIKLFGVASLVLGIILINFG